MDLNKFKNAFEKMNYDSKSKFEIKLHKLNSTFIITETADIESASDFIAAILQSDDQKIIGSIVVQESINCSFKSLLREKVKQLIESKEVKELTDKGFEFIAGRIVACPRNIIANEEAPIISYEVYRTTKEGISLSKNSISVALWSQNISIAYEFITALNTAAQIWLNSSFGSISTKVPFLSNNGKEVVGDLKQQTIIEVAGNTQFQSSFQNGKFKTVVIPFGETFAN